ncbi:hypothetical protein ACNKHW_07085 [Shigella flexneri]
MRTFRAADGLWEGHLG